MSDGQPHFVPPPERRCRFVKTSGARCTQPAMREHDLCFDHKYKLRVIRGQVRRLQREEPLKVPLITCTQVEDHHSILRNLNEIAQQLANGAIDVHQARTFSSIQRTALKTLRQMRDIEKLEPQVEACVEVDGQPMAIPEDSPVVVEPSAGSIASPAAQPAAQLPTQLAALSGLEPEPLEAEPVDRPPCHEHAPPRVPGLSFNPYTEEGSYNLGQEYIWGYCHKDPVKGLEFGIDLNWPGRPASFVLPPGFVATTAASPAQPAPAPEASNPAPQKRPAPEAQRGLALRAAARRSSINPAESKRPSASWPVTLLESTHTPKTSPNPFVSHTSANTRKNFGAGGRKAVARKNGTSSKRRQTG